MMGEAKRGAGVCLVGAGYISSAHADALRALGIPLVAVVDPNAKARTKLAASFEIANTYATVDEALEAAHFDRVHLLVPPDSHHEIAVRLLRAGKAVLVEKPLATTLAACDAMIDAASTHGLLGVNQNFVYHPAFVRLRQSLERNEFGPPRFIDVVYHAPLRQLASRQFGHWMFREARNILLEQAVHPLSQLVTLSGPIGAIRVIGGDPVEIAPGAAFVPSFSASLQGTRAAATLRFAVGESFPFWQISVVCDDGVLFADMLANRFWTLGRTRWMQAIDDFVMGQASAAAISGGSWRNFLAYSLATVKLGRRSDSFFLSMHDSIAEFHHALDAQKTPPLDATFGRYMVELCDRIAAEIMPRTKVIPAKIASPPSTTSCDVAVLGGTGFIGSALVARLRQAGLSVSVMARNLANLPKPCSEPGVSLHRGDIRSAEDVRHAIANARVVINLAHGGGGSSWDEIRDAMTGGAEIVARECLAAGTRRLIYVGSIAALYLGPQSGAVTGATPPDPRAGERADYARAKALCEGRMWEMLRGSSTELCIIRPGLVVGPGTSPFHSGLGLFNNDQHCIGWNDGRNRLPFVLVDDVADAITMACTSAAAAGKSYNLVGDFLPSAREYLAELARVLHRPLRFHGHSPHALYLIELAKWTVKRAGGRRVPVPSLHDILSRGLKARFDCSDAKVDLEWSPVSDAARFYAKAFETLGPE